MEEKRRVTFYRMTQSWSVGLVSDNTILVVVLSNGVTDVRNPGTKWLSVSRRITAVSVDNGVMPDHRSVIGKYITWV